jgi:DNA-binding XRE family transcriptional regulator
MEMSKRQNPTEFKWTWQRTKAAKLIAEGELNQEEIAKECHVVRQTVSGWNQSPEFKEKVMELVLLDERATKAGILRRALKTLEAKARQAAEDKTTELDYLKFIADLVGITDQSPQVNITNAVGIINSPDIIKDANELSRKINAAYEAEHEDAE